MKKLFALLLVCACLLSLGTAALAEGEEMVPVCVSVPETWEAPCLWAWADDGTNAFAAWPGEAMTETDGWYALEAHGWINSVIINANEGSVQTSDLTVETGKDVWVVVNGPEDAVVS